MRHSDYDSPEEASGHGADERSDIYFLGAVLYEMLTTRRPLHRGSAAPSASNRNVPSEVDKIVLKAATLVAELRIVAAILDVRGGAGNAGGHREEPMTSVGRALIMTTVILVGLGLLAWSFAAR